MTASPIIASDAAIMIGGAATHREPTDKTGGTCPRPVDQAACISEQARKGGGTARTKAPPLKATVEYWRGRIRRRVLPDGKKADEYSVRIGFDGQSARFDLGTSDEAAAAEKALEIHHFLRERGWRTARAKYIKGLATRYVTVGEFLKLADARPSLRGFLGARPAPRRITVENYHAKVRTLVGHVIGMPGAARGAKSCTGRASSAAWRARIDATPLDDGTDARISGWAANYVTARSTNAHERSRAINTVNSLLRAARALFTREHLARVPDDVLLPNPPLLSTVRLLMPVTLPHCQEIDAARLARDARAELEREDPEAHKALVLFLCLGLTRREADDLHWTSVEDTVRIEDRDFLDWGRFALLPPVREIHIQPSLRPLIERWRSRKRGKFVIECPGTERPRRTCQEYRCDRIFRRLMTWLRGKGVTARAPLHALRLESDRLVAELHDRISGASFFREKGLRYECDPSYARRYGTGLEELIAEAAHQPTVSPDAGVASGPK